MSGFLRTWRRRKTASSVQVILITGLLMLVVNAEQITTTIHSTHAYVKLAPEFCCAGTIIGGCGRKYDAWTLTTYTSSNDKKYTFHQAQSAGNDLDHRNSTRRMSISFKGTSVYLYMAPRRFLHHPPGNQQICMYGTCRTIDISRRYKAAGDSNDPVLMWWAENLDQDQVTELDLRLIDDGWGDNTRSMSFQYLRYTQVVKNTTRPPLKEGTRLINATLHDTNYAVNYAPKTSHANCCGDYNPWEKRLWISSMGLANSFHQTLTWGNDPTGDEIRQLSFTFQGTAIYLYGPPPAALELWGEGRMHGHQEVCLGNQCAGIDVHQVYLNVELARRNDFVLLWSLDLLSPNPQAHATFDLLSLGNPTTFRLRLVDSYSPVRESQLIFDHAVVSEVRSLPLWHHPLPDGWYSATAVGFDGPITYTPQATAWTNLVFFLWSISMEARDVLFDNVMPGWQYSFKGHDIKIYGAPKSYIGNAEHATQTICVDTECHYVDVEQAYLATSLWNLWKPVLLLHVADLNPFIVHNISTVAVRKNGDTADPRVMTFHSLEYQTFTPGAPPPKPAPEPWPTFEWPDFGILWKVFMNILLAIICVLLALITCGFVIDILVTVLAALWTVIQMLPIVLVGIICGIGYLLGTIATGLAYMADVIVAGLVCVALGALLVIGGMGYLLITLPVWLARVLLGMAQRTASRDSETGGETEPLFPDRAPSPPRPPPPQPHTSVQPARYTPASISSLPPNITPTSIPISQHPPPPYLLTTADDSWVVGTPETTFAAPPAYIPTNHAGGGPVMVTMPIPLEIDEVPSGALASQTTPATSDLLELPLPSVPGGGHSHLHRLESPAANPPSTHLSFPTTSQQRPLATIIEHHPDDLVPLSITTATDSGQYHAAAPVLDGTHDYRASVVTSQRRPSGSAITPTPPTIRDYGATSQQHPGDVGVVNPAPRSRRSRHRASRPQESPGNTNDEPWSSANASGREEANRPRSGPVQANGPPIRILAPEMRQLGVNAQASVGTSDYPSRTYQLQNATEAPNRAAPESCVGSGIREPHAELNGGRGSGQRSRGGRTQGVIGATPVAQEQSNATGPSPGSGRGRGRGNGRGRGRGRGRRPGGDGAPGNSAS